MKSLLNRGVPTPRRPTEGGRVFFVAVFVIILMVGAAIVLRIAQEVTRHKSKLVTETDVHKLDPELLML